MKTILEEIQELKNWDYYERETKYELNKIEDWNDEKKHEEFIEKFLLISEINKDVKSIEVINDLLEYTKQNQSLLKNEEMKNLFDVIPNYFKYRFEDKKLDHGIFTGIKLFDFLERNRQEREGQKDNEEEVLYWGDDLIPFYAQASLAIAMHNIWLSNDSNKEKYTAFGLKSLITEETKIFPISIKDNPLLFLLGLVDTIEPTKTFNCVEPKYVLENILIDFDENKNGSGLDFEKLKRNAKGLESWLDIEPLIVETNKIKIIIKR